MALVSLLINVMMFLLVVRMVLSWVAADSYNEIIRAIYAATDPILKPFKRLPLTIGPVDFTPIVAFVLLNFLGKLTISVLARIAIKLGS
jgi:YggT family protein